MPRIARGADGRRLRGPDGRLFRACCCDSPGGCELCGPSPGAVTVQFDELTICPDGMCEWVHPLGENRCALDVFHEPGPHVVPLFWSGENHSYGQLLCIFAKALGDTPAPCVGAYPDPLWPLLLGFPPGSDWWSWFEQTTAQNIWFDLGGPEGMILIYMAKWYEAPNTWTARVRYWAPNQWWYPSPIGPFVCGEASRCPRVAFWNIQPAWVPNLNCETPIVVGDESSPNILPPCTPDVCYSHVAHGGTATITLGP